MKKITFLLALIALLGLQVAQAQVITGTVSDENGEPVPGVTVTAKGLSGVGTITGPNGKYSLDPQGADALQFSFVGMETVVEAISGRSVINVVMKPEDIAVKEVVVTALGIKRETKALGYSATTVDNEEITKSKDHSAMNSLQGKVAGVNISSASGSPSASTKVILRGYSSLGGSNQPLYVVDGVPINNSLVGSTSLNNGTDFGNQANDINPEDIASISVLKGSAGTALYGSRAANGVIIITTKKGEATKGKKADINVSSSVSFSEPLRLVKYQNEFGQGINGNAVSYENMSWGPAFDGEKRVWGHIVDNAQRIKPYVALPDNVEEFFDVGLRFNNNISVSGGNEESTYYLSYGNITSDGFFPTDADSYNRNTLSFRGTSKLSSKLTSSASVNYVKKTASFVPTGQDQSVYNNIMQTPRDISLLEIKDYQNKWNNLDNHYSQYTENPWYVLNEHGNDENTDRIYGNTNIDYQITDYLSLSGRLGADVSNTQLKQWREITVPEGNNSTKDADLGRVVEDTYYRMQLNSDLMLNFNKSFGDFDVNAILGHNLNQRTYKHVGAQVLGLDIPDYFNLSNSSSSPTVTEFYRKRRLIGAYTNIDLAFKDMLYLTATARNDWSSTLPEENRSFFYPSVNLSFNFTELMPGIENVLSFGKIRAGWGQTGNDAEPYQIYSTMLQAGFFDGYRGLTFPLPNGVNAFEVENTIGNANLQPEITTELEAGVDLRFFQGRATVDFTYYDKTITDLIWNADISRSSGYSVQTMNLGEITNKGVELLVGVTPVQTKDFRWKLTFNYTKNNNELVRLNEDLDEVLIQSIGVSGGQQHEFLGIPGQPLGVFKCRDVARDPEGNIIVDNTGMPKATDTLVIAGDSEYDYIAGVSTSFSYKGFSLSATLDIRQGGLMYSRTKEISTWAGTTPQTLYNNRQPFIVPNSVIETYDAEGNVQYVENTKPIDSEHLTDYWGQGGLDMDKHFLIDKSFAKLREVTLSYSMPGKWFATSPIGGIEISISGRNLYVWTPEEQTFIDPEATTFGNDLTADFGEYSATPSARTITGSLRLKF